MRYVLTWPSDVGPCVVFVSLAAFVHRLRSDLHAVRSAAVLRYPPPAWSRVVRCTDTAGRGFTGARWLFVAAMVSIALSASYQYGHLSGFGEAVQLQQSVQQVRQPLVV